MRKMFITSLGILATLLIVVGVLIVPHQFFIQQKRQSTPGYSQVRLRGTFRKRYSSIPQRGPYILTVTIL